MTGLDIEQHTIVEIACSSPTPTSTPLDDGIDLVVHADADALARMDDFVRKMHTKSGLLPAIEASDVSVADAEAPRARVRARPRARRRAPRRCAATASASTAASSTATCPTSTRTCTTAASTCRRSRSCAGAGIPTIYKQAAGQVRAAPRPRRHPRVDRGAALLPREAVHSRAPDPASDFGARRRSRRQSATAARPPSRRRGPQSLAR